MRVILPEEMANVDRAATEQRNIPSLELMERAGEAVARAARDMLTAAGGRRVAILCGKGNNGGDGLVAARRLAGPFDVTVYVVGAEGLESLSSDSAANMTRLGETPVPVRWIPDGAQERPPVFGSTQFDVLVDALFGTGFTGRVSGVHASFIEAMNDSGLPVLAVDIPSGVAGDTGAVESEAVIAERTVTFAAPKVGLLQYPGAGYVGEMDVADIGIPEDLVDAIVRSRIFLTTEDDAESLLPARAPDSHKGDCGRVLVIGGSPGMTGAPAMAGQAALRCGAGLVTIAVPGGLADILEIKLTEVMTLAVLQTAARTLSGEAVADLLDEGARFDAIALGPGISTAPETMGAVRRLVEGIEAPLVLDADGLTAMVGHIGVMSGRSRPLVVTPHPGEMARLLGTTAAAVQATRLDSARRAAEDWNAVVVLKGAGTLIAEPGGDTFINPTGNAGMATAGMGDVLTGCIASFIAQGLGPFGAAVAGAWYHGHSGDLAAQMEGMAGLTAGDVIRHLPLAIRRISEERWLT